MPTVIIEGYKFRFYSSDRHEPPHMHVIKGEHVAKIWLQPVEIEYNRGYSKTVLTRILKITNENHDRLLEAWHEYFAQ